MLDNNTVYFLNSIWTYCTCMYYVSEINEYYYKKLYANDRHRSDDIIGDTLQLLLGCLHTETVSKATAYIISRVQLCS